MINDNDDNEDHDNDDCNNENDHDDDDTLQELRVEAPEVAVDVFDAVDVDGFRY